MAASPMASSAGSQAGDENDPLELTSLDADSLFAALGAVEKVNCIVFAEDIRRTVHVA